MASTQCEKKQLSCEQKANLDKSIKCAEEFYISKDIANKARDIIAEKECKNKGEVDAKRLSALAGAMTNQTTKGSLYVITSKQWKGYTVYDYTDPLEMFGTFAQAAVFGGIEAAVVYGGKNKNGIECAWLLAWSDTNGNRKVYAECGHRNKFENINWNRIRSELSDADFIATANDSETGISMYATNLGVSPGSAVGVYYSG